MAKVYLSIYSDEPGKAVAMEGLQRLEGYVRKHIGRQVRPARARAAAGDCRRMDALAAGGQRGC